MGLAPVLVLATLLSGLVAGFCFAFAVVVMPGIRALEDREFLRAFRVIDGVIQRGQPLFGMVWLGSAAALLVGMGIGFAQLQGPDRLLLLAAGLTYLIGVQLPTFAVNVPLNIRLQSLDLDSVDDSSCRVARNEFEGRWNRWNTVRTVVATLVTATLLSLLLGL